MEKMFVHIAKKANFTEALKTKYANSIVFLKDTQEIWTHDTFYAIPDSYKTRITNAESAINALKAIYSFDTISDGANTVQATAEAKTIKFTGAGGVAVTVSADGVKVDGTTIKNAAAVAKKAGDDAKAAATENRTIINAHIGNTDNPHGVTKAQVGLGNVENKTVAQILASAALTGVPTAPTAAAGTNTTQVATTAFVKAAVDTLGNAVAAALRYKGTIGSTGADITALPASHNIGDVYIAKTAGTYAGQVCEVGDMIICSKTSSAAADADWQVIQANINGAITGSIDMTANQLVIGNGSKTVKPLAGGSNGQVLKMVGGVPAWAADIDTNTTYTFANGANGSFTVTPSGGSAQTVSIGKPATATSADQAAKLTTARTVAVSGAVSGSVSFDGTKDVTISTTLANIASDKVAAMTGYTKPAAVSAISATDTLNAAIGKLEAMFDWEEL